MSKEPHIMFSGLGDMSKEMQIEALKILKQVVKLNGECDHWDHHGYCQTHNLQEKEDCYVFRASSLIIKLQKQVLDEISKLENKCKEMNE